MNLRKCEIQKNEYSSIENKNPKILCFFHKWFDGLNDTFEFPRQFAIIEHQDGTIEQIWIEEYHIRFLTDVEMEKLKKEESDKSLSQMYGNK